MPLAFYRLITHRSLIRFPRNRLEEQRHRPSLPDVLLEALRQEIYFCRCSYLALARESPETVGHLSSATVCVIVWVGRRVSGKWVWTGKSSDDVTGRLWVSRSDDPTSSGESAETLDGDKTEGKIGLG